jgi:riboflavin biosynthesis pyrimidine reductase
MRQLLPFSAEAVDLAHVYQHDAAPAGRPFVRLNMIASVDGAVTVGGTSGSLGGPGDHALFEALRSIADVVLVAAGTARAEGYGPAILPEPVRATRVAEGRSPVPAIAVVSRSCALDFDSPFFTAASVRPIVVTVAAAPRERRERAAEVADVIIAGDSDVDLSLALEAIGARGARSVLAKGGPSFNGQLAGGGHLDELCLTLSPRLVSGDARRILSGDVLDMMSELHLVSVCEEDDYLFLRYSVS